jgi:hypothetical protein
MKTTDMKNMDAGRKEDPLFEVIDSGEIEGGT